MDNQKSYDLWPSCDPNKELCDGGGDEERLRGNKHLWNSVLDQFRKNLKWRGTISFDEWVLIVYGKVDIDRRMEIWNEVSQVQNDDQFPNKETKKPQSKEEKANADFGNKYWCEKVKIHHENGVSFWASCDPYKDKCDGGSSKKWVGDMSYYWKSTNDS